MPVDKLIRSTSLDYVRRACRRPGSRTGHHADVMLKELIDDMTGQSPGTCQSDHWPIRRKAVHDVADMDTLVEPPPGDVIAATSFTIF